MTFLVFSKVCITVAVLALAAGALTPAVHAKVWKAFSAIVLLSLVALVIAAVWMP